MTGMAGPKKHLSQSAAGGPTATVRPILEASLLPAPVGAPMVEDVDQVSASMPLAG